MNVGASVTYNTRAHHMPTGKKARTRSGQRGKSLSKGSPEHGAAKSRAGRRTNAPRATKRSAAAYASVALDPGVANLDKIKHVVALMMENRSFDQMLGYLTLKGVRVDINALTPAMKNTYEGTPYPVHHLNSTTLRSDQDPCHDGRCVAEQLADDNQGFVRNYAATHPGYPADYGLVMGYFDETQVPAYGFLAEEFTVCDQWYSSVRGATWPNRLYALAGRAAGSKDNPPGVPRYNVPSFVRRLDAANVSWKWYCYPLLNPWGGILTTLQIADDQYNTSTAGNSAFCDPDFFDDAANGRLASVSWIDPDFGYPFHGRYENDDHPPADVMAGQELVSKVFHAVSQGPLWKETLLVIVYDEHGGFYDHQYPTATPEDDDPDFREYGARVPAFVISPWAKRRFVATDCYDHTSLIKTILLRFCRTNDQIPDLGARVNAARHLGGLLSLDTPRDAPSPPDYQPVIDRIAQWRAQEVQQAFMEDRVRGQEPQPQLTEFQRGLERAAKANATRERTRAARRRKQGPLKKAPKGHRRARGRKRAT